MTDDEGRSVYSHIFRPTSVDGVILEEVSDLFGLRKIVDRDDLKLRGPREREARDLSANSSKSIDRNFNRLSHAPSIHLTEAWLNSGFRERRDFRVN
jgi:hypothetical protein